MLLTTASAICYAIATSLVMLELSPGVWYAVAAVPGLCDVQSVAGMSVLAGCQLTEASGCHCTFLLRDACLAHDL